jgi:lantibiotic modifying enzyme
MDNVADVSEVPGAFIFVVEGGKMYLRNNHNTDNMRAVQRQTTIFSMNNKPPFKFGINKNFIYSIWSL